ncbi:MAG: beta-galactosidase, partial [Balneolaceae bacterium]|nr:beta-galactosidase [Balneolaceae bacterium]
MSASPELGVCYYPEHWPEDMWISDAQSMYKNGIRWVRIAEFAWSRIEPEPKKFDWAWLDKAVDILGNAGLKIVMCTPTATPPRWLINQMPDMLAVDQNGQKRKFGSRKHYSFSHKGYQKESQRITQAVAERYGNNSFIQAWQTDNEFGCHETTYSWCQSSLQEFRNWLKVKYQSIEKLNEEWGNVFWSMEYSSFEDIDLPNLTVTEANPAHHFAFRRFSSDQVKNFNSQQVKIINQFSPDRPVSHNYMGHFVEFDHHKVSEDLDIAAWDSYPLGFLQNMQSIAREDKKLLLECYNIGDPDFQAYHHDLYRGMGRLWVMEQQPGPVNWAKYNPIPLPGAVRMWTWEAFAHNAEVVSYFRWRQASYAQEQMHAGLMHCDNSPSVGSKEALQVSKEIQEIELPPTQKADIALLHDYEACWMTEIDGQTQDFHYTRLMLDFYKSIRRNGGSLDIIGKNTDFTGYKLIIIPSFVHLDEEIFNRITLSGARILAGPRTGVKTNGFQIPPNLSLEGLGFKVTRVDALPQELPLEVEWKDIKGYMSVWREQGQCSGTSDGKGVDGMPVLTTGNKGSYLCGWPDENLLKAIMREQMQSVGIETVSLPEYLR